MAIHKSVIKRQKQADKKHLVNKSVKSALKTITKKVEQAAEEKKVDAAKEALVKAMKAYNKAASAGVLHKATASRKISRLSVKVSKITMAQLPDHSLQHQSSGKAARFKRPVRLQHGAEGLTQLVHRIPLHLVLEQTCLMEDNPEFFHDFIRPNACRLHGFCLEEPPEVPRD